MVEDVGGRKIKGHYCKKYTLKTPFNQIFFFFYLETPFNQIFTIFSSIRSVGRKIYLKKQNKKEKKERFPQI